MSEVPLHSTRLPGRIASTTAAADRDACTRTRSTSQQSSLRTSALTLTAAIRIVQLTWTLTHPPSRPLAHAQLRPPWRARISLSIQHHNLDHF
jgi:hypothetical protein